MTALIAVVAIFPDGTAEPAKLFLAIKEFPGARGANFDELASIMKNIHNCNSFRANICPASSGGHYSVFFSMAGVYGTFAEPITRFVGHGAGYIVKLDGESRPQDIDIDEFVREFNQISAPSTGYEMKKLKRRRYKLVKTDGKYSARRHSNQCIVG